MTRPTSITLTAILTIALLATTAAVAPAAADHDPDDDSGGLGDALSAPANALDFIIGFGGGGIDRVSYAINGPNDDADTNRDDLQTEFNTHNTTLREYANARDIHEGEVAQIDCTIDGDTATLYLVADYNNSSSEYESVEAVQTTDRDVDHTVTLRGMACDNAAGEIDAFVDAYAEPGNDVDSRYAGRMASKYKGKIDEPFTGGSD